MVSKLDKPEKWVAHEVVKARYVERYRRRGWLTRDFFIGPDRYLWRMNTEDKKTGDLLRHGILVELLSSLEPKSPGSPGG